MVGYRIAALRRRAGMSQRELAERLSVSPSTVGMYEQERREPDADRLVALSAVFGVSCDYLLTGEERDAGAVLRAAASRLNGALRLRAADGTERPFDVGELALLLAALPH